MEIGPINSVRPISPVKPSSSAPDLSGVFAVEFRGRQQDESSSSSYRKAFRGLEEEETEDESLMDDGAGAAENAAMADGDDHRAERQVSIFA